MTLIFCLQINIKGFLKLILSLGGCVAMYAQITQNNKFSISLQYWKKEMTYEVGFLHEDKHERFLQIVNMVFDRDDQAFPKFPK